VTLGEFGVDVPAAEETDEPADHHTTDDYKYSRPQCRALTNAGDRCSNPVRRAEGAEFCPRHHGADAETIDDTEGDSS